jgi:hypothetical protein
MQGGQQAVDIVALFLAPFFAVMIAFALAAFSPLNRIMRPIRFFLFACIGGVVAAMILIVVGLLGKISSGVWRFDIVISFIGCAVIGLSQFWSSETIVDKKKDERIHKQDSGWF